MSMSKNTIRLYITFFSLIVLYESSANAAETYIRDGFIEAGYEQEYSDNINKSSDVKRSGTTSIVDIELGYEQYKASSEVAFNYYAEYSDTRNSDVQSDSYWIGHSTISQDIFSKNIVFNLEHTRQRYILDQSQADLDSNKDSRDLLTGGLQWVIPYSPRTSFILNATHSQTWFKEEKANNSSNNAGQISWQYALDKTSQLQVSIAGSKNKFDGFDYAYNEYNLDTSLTSQYLLGNYSLNIGTTWADNGNEKTDVQHYGLTVDAQINNVLFIFNASKILTNTSDQIRVNDDSDFSKNEIFLLHHISLQQQSAIIDQRLLSSMMLYYEHDDAIASIDNTGVDDKDRYGANGELTWSLTKKLKANLSLNYYNSKLSNGDTKQFSEAKLGSRYNFNTSIYIQFTVSFLKQHYRQNTSGYEEKNYSTRIAYRY